MSVTKHLIFALTVLFSSVGAIAASPTIKSEAQQIREFFATQVASTIDAAMPFEVFTEGPAATRLVILVEKGIGGTPRASSPVEMEAKRLGFHDIVYRTPRGAITVKL